MVCKVAGNDTQWKEARRKEEIMFLGKMGLKLPVSGGGSVEKSFSFLAKQQQQLTEGHNHSSAVDSAANLTNQHSNVRTVTLAKQTGLTILKAQSM